MNRWWVSGCLVMLALSGVAVAGKDPAKPSKPKATPAKPVEAEAAPAADAGSAAKPTDDDDGGDPLATIPHIVGPKRVDLGHHAQLDLPAGMNLLEEKTAKEVMTKLGNGTEGLVAVILPPPGAAEWLVAIEARDVGYVSDSDADELDAGALLEDYRKGTAEQNKTRVAMGSTELAVDGWSEKPRYERTKHQLVWGLTGHATKDGKATGEKIVNFTTRFLGRNGFLSVDLIGEPDTIEQSKTQALSVLTALQFAPGFRYENHSSDDHDSGLGLKALVVGGTAVVLAKKGGLLIGLLLVLKKGLILVVAAIAGFFKWLFGRKKSDTDLTPPPAAGPPDMGPTSMG